MSQHTAQERERFGSRLGFILVSAGCAVGLGNVWRFPYITGEYGGAAFVLLYLAFLVIFTLPILVMEFSVGRASQKSLARAYDELEPAGSKWHHAKWISLVGNYLLMMFYTTVAGWMLAFCVKGAFGQLSNITTDQTAAIFSGMLANPAEMLTYLIIVVLIGTLACTAGIQKGVERVTKVMMSALFVIMIILCVRAVTLPGAGGGLAFYLVPDFSKIFGNGLLGAWDAVFAAMGQAFFTMSVGIGSMAIFGSFIDKKHTLPAVFDMMPLGQLWCTLFFLFMSFAALSTVIAVFENINSFTMDQWGTPRKKACLVNGGLIFVLSLPCLLGFNVLSGVSFPGIGDIQGLEDFIVSNNLLPLGGLIILLFCTRKGGWGFDSFLAEADTGSGLKFPRWIKGYLSYVLPLLIIVVLVGGWIPVIQAWLGMA